MTPAGTSNELDVQNEWEENTHTQQKVVYAVDMMYGGPCHLYAGGEDPTVIQNIRHGKTLFENEKLACVILGTMFDL